MATYTQTGRRLTLHTPLGKDALLLERLNGQEEMSKLFKFQLEMVSERDSIAAKDIVGKNVTFTVDLPDQTPRYFNGFVSRFSFCGTEGRLSRFKAEVVPWFWFLDQTADCRIFQGETVPQIVKKIFDEMKFTDYEDKELFKDDEKKHPKRDYCVQYRETDFHFISRLLEEEGIFYFFRHENGKHVLVLGEKPGAYRDCQEYEVSCAASPNTTDPAEKIRTWEHQYEFRPGKFAQTDYDFENPGTPLVTGTKTVVKLDGVAGYEMFDFPGLYKEKGVGEELMKVRMEEIEAAHDVVRGTSICRTFTPGGKFKLVGHAASGEEGKIYIITSVQHSASLGGSYQTGGGGGGEAEYRNSFVCIPDAVNFRPQRTTVKPVVRGAQSALVVGPEGEEIHTDEFGRVRVQFFWDREHQKNDKSSFWARVCHPWAGKNWGMIAIPRIGQEVIIDFLEGDPDRPIIIGRVYNADQMPPYPLPDQAMVSGVKTNSTPGGDGYNEISMDDTKGKEKLTIHGQFDMATTVEHNLSETVKTGNRTMTVSSGTSSVTIQGNASLTVKAGRRKVDVTGGDYEATASDAVILHGKGKGVSITGDVEGVTVKGNGKGVTIKGDPSFSATGVSTAELKSPKVTIGDKEIIIDGTTVTIKHGAIEINGTEVKIIAGPSSITLNSSGVEIKGPVVKANC